MILLPQYVRVGDSLMPFAEDRYYPVTAKLYHRRRMVYTFTLSGHEPVEVLRSHAVESKPHP